MASLYQNHSLRSLCLFFVLHNTVVTNRELTVKILLVFCLQKVHVYLLIKRNSKEQKALLAG